MKGYLLTYLIAYVRDFAYQYFCVAESFETSVPWSQVSELCRRVDNRIREEAKREGVTGKHVWVSFRVTQLYETGAAVYVYAALNLKNTPLQNVPKEEQVAAYERIEDGARDEVMNCGGCISHHHGVGKIRKRFIERSLPPMAIEWQKKMKDAVDPTNVFGINNTVIRSEEEAKEINKFPIRPINSK